MLLSLETANILDVYLQACEEYLTEEQVAQDIATKKTIRGILRINAKQYTDAFISDPVIEFVFMNIIETGIFFLLGWWK